LVIVKLQLGAVCVKVYVIDCVIVCSPTGQVVVTISVVRLYAPARLEQPSLETPLSSGVLPGLVLSLELLPHAIKHNEPATAANSLVFVMSVLSSFPQESRSGSGPRE
jgi:hypothetical protein